jgi:PAT family beta-lactamase induction signal transducer AmpG
METISQAQVSVFRHLMNPRLLVVMFLGFSSGLPLALTGSTLEAWFATSDKSYIEIGFITLVGTPYVFKFLWAPLVDRYVWPFLGPRRGWMLVTQLLLLGGIASMAMFDPINTPLLLAGMAISVAFVSATQDIAVDAYRAEILPPEERGMGAAFSVAAYRVALILSTGVALVLADSIGWEQTYMIMAGLMAVGIITTLLCLEPDHFEHRPTTLVDAVVKPFMEFMTRPAAVWLLLIIIFYKFGDAFIMKMQTAFLIRGLGFSLTEVGTVTKIGGWGFSILGAFLGGAIMTRISLFKAMMIFGFFQAFSNLMFLWLAWMGHNFWAMASTILVENFCSGLGIAAFVAFLMSLCDRRYTAFQFAIFSALSAVGREFLGPLSGYLVEYHGWTVFFTMTFIASFPGLIFLWLARNRIGIR